MFTLTDSEWGVCQTEYRYEDLVVGGRRIGDLEDTNTICIMYILTLFKIAELNGKKAWWSDCDIKGNPYCRSGNTCVGCIQLKGKKEIRFSFKVSDIPKSALSFFNKFKVPKALKKLYSAEIRANDLCEQKLIDFLQD